MEAETSYQRHYKKNRERLIARSVETTRGRRKKTKKFLNKMKDEANCADCGESYPGKPWRMSFDHLPEFEKVGDVGTLAMNRGWSEKRIMEEIDKCEIVCLLCHADRTMARRGVLV